MAQDSTYYARRCARTLKAIKAHYAAKSSFNDVAAMLDGHYPHVPIWPEDVRRAVVEDYVRPAIVKVMAPPRKRVRWSPDCTPELRDAIRAECDRRGITAGQMLERMWQCHKSTSY